MEIPDANRSKTTNFMAEWNIKGGKQLILLMNVETLRS